MCLTIFGRDITRVSNKRVVYKIALKTKAGYYYPPIRSKYSKFARDRYTLGKRKFSNREGLAAGDDFNDESWVSAYGVSNIKINRGIHVFLNLNDMRYRLEEFEWDNKKYRSNSYVILKCRVRRSDFIGMNSVEGHAVYHSILPLEEVEF